MAEHKDVRDTESGQYVPAEEAAKRPWTTVSETRQAPRPMTPDEIEDILRALCTQVSDLTDRIEEMAAALFIPKTDHT